MLTPESAVQRCLDAYDRACERDDARNDYTPESLHRVRSAWRHAMPILTSDPDAIDAFIACVTHGMILEIFTVVEASKLLYAAQVAIGSRRARQQAARAQVNQHPTPSPSPKDAPPLATLPSSLGVADHSPGQLPSLPAFPPPPARKSSPAPGLLT